MNVALILLFIVILIVNFKIERWTSRTNQIMMQSTKSDNEELKKLQMLKTQNEKVTAALQEDLKKIKQQFDTFKRETLKSKNESQVNLFKIF